MGMRHVLLALAALLACGAAPARGALLAIDYGSEFLKMALVAPGRSPISIVNNEISKRKSPAAVSFVGGVRALGDEAHALGTRYPDRVLYRLRDLVGLQASSPAVGGLLSASYLPYAVAPDPARGTVLLTVDGQQLSVEEAAASVLHYARLCAEAQAGAPIKDVVITVPAFFSQAQRQGLLDAAGIAGLNVMSLVSEHAAAAIKYGIDKDFANTTELMARLARAPRAARGWRAPSASLAAAPTRRPRAPTPRRTPRRAGDLRLWRRLHHRHAAAVFLLEDEGAGQGEESRPVRGQRHQVGRHRRRGGAGSGARRRARPRRP